MTQRDSDDQLMWAFGCLDMILSYCSWKKRGPLGKAEPIGNITLDF
jgi:hypothetical protein